MFGSLLRVYDDRVWGRSMYTCVPPLVPTAGLAAGFFFLGKNKTNKHFDEPWRKDKIGRKWNSSKSGKFFWLTLQLFFVMQLRSSSVTDLRLSCPTTLCICAPATTSAYIHHPRFRPPTPTRSHLHVRIDGHAVRPHRRPPHAPSPPRRPLPQHRRGRLCILYIKRQTTNKPPRHVNPCTTNTKHTLHPTHPTKQRTQQHTSCSAPDGKEGNAATAAATAARARSCSASASRLTVLLPPAPVSPSSSPLSVCAWGRVGYCVALRAVWVPILFTYKPQSHMTTHTHPAKPRVVVGVGGGGARMER